MIILPILEQLFYMKYVTPVFLLCFVFGLLYRIIWRCRA